MSQKQFESAKIMYLMLIFYVLLLGWVNSFLKCDPRVLNLEYLVMCFICAIVTIFPMVFSFYFVEDKKE